MSILNAAQRLAWQCEAVDRKIINGIKGLHISSLSVKQTEILVSGSLKQSCRRCPNCGVISKKPCGWHHRQLADDTPAGVSKKSPAAQHHARVRMAKIQSREALYQRAHQMSDDGVRIADIAKELGFKPTTIYRWFRNGGTWRRREKPLAKTSPRYFEPFLRERWEAEAKPNASAAG